jgi:hypothetical protein
METDTTFLPSALDETASLDWAEVTKRYNASRLPTKKIDRERVANAFHDAFDLIGGVPRLAWWAHHDPGEFYKLYAKLLPTQVKAEFDGKLEIVCAVRPTALDGESVDATRSKENGGGVASMETGKSKD